MSNKALALLKKKRFFPFFVTQFLGAFNDNVFKNALVILVTFQAAQFATDGESLNSDFLVNLCAGLFILPFFLFSATAGQIADKYEKSRLIRIIKCCEIGIMAFAAAGFYFGNLYFLILILFLMGAQSSFFGPIKYAILPQHLNDKELIAGNAMIELGTFIAILVGIIVGSKLISVDANAELIVSILILVVAFLGYLFSRQIPSAAASDPKLKMNWNPISETLNTLAYTRENLVVFRSILGISWFWFFGATLLTQLPNLSKDVLGANDDVFILLVSMFSIGVAVGSLLCERLSGDVVEIGLVPIGSSMLTLFAAHLYFSTSSFIEPNLSHLSVVGSEFGSLIGVSEFLAHSKAWWVLIDVLMIGVFGGFFIVPLYALVQQRSDARIRSRIIAGNNILNALFMVLSAALSVALLLSGFSIPELILVTAILNLLIAAYIFTLVPEFMMRCLIWCMVNVFYRLKKEGLDNIPEDGAALVVCNHVSFMDALVIASCSRRPIRFVMYHKIFAIPVLSFIFKTGNAIPIAPKHEDEKLMNAAFDAIAQALDDQELVCIFPEGKLTSDGEIGPFKPGVERILITNPVPVVPMALQGFWGSFFSRKDNAALKRPFRRFWSKVRLKVGKPMVVGEGDLALLRENVLELRGEFK